MPTTFQTVLSRRFACAIALAAATALPAAAQDTAQNNEGRDEYSKIALNLFNILDTQTALGALDTHLLLPPQAAQKTAAQTATTRPFFTEHINTAPAWSAWVRAERGKLEGAPQVAGERTEYNGDSFGVFIGTDQKVRDDNVRAGLAAGSSAVEIATAFPAATATVVAAERAKNDIISRRLNSLMSYIEWRKNPWQLRAVGGAGKGDLQIRQGDETCDADMDSTVFFGGLSGAYHTPFLLKAISGLQTHVIGDVSYSVSEADAGRCVAGGGGVSAGTPIPATGSVAGGEWEAGLNFVYAGAFHNYIARNNWQARNSFSATGRGIFGDISDSGAYGVAADLIFHRVGDDALVFELGGKWQLNKTDHRRSGYNAAITYRRGALYSTFRAENAGGGGGGFSPRWQIAYAKTAAAQTLAANFHLQAGAAAANRAAAAEIKFSF